MATKQKSFKELHKDLEKAQKALEEQRQKAKELEEQLGPALDAEIVRLVRAKYSNDSDLFDLLQNIQAGAIEITFVPVEPKNLFEGDDTNDIDS